MLTRPDDLAQIVGQNFINRNNAVVLSLGERKYDKYQLGAIGVPHIQSARELDRAIKQLNIKDIRELALKHSPEDFVELKGFGVTAMYALICVLKDAQIPLSRFYKSKVTVASLTKQVRKRTKKRSAA